MSNPEVDPTKPTGTVEPTMFEEPTNDGPSDSGTSTSRPGFARTTTDAGSQQPIEPSEPPTGSTVSTDSTSNKSSDSSSNDSSDSQSNEDVVLYLPHVDNSFRYGESDDEVIIGQQGKQFSRSEADRILELAQNNDVTLLERGLGELI